MSRRRCPLRSLLQPSSHQQRFGGEVASGGQVIGQGGGEVAGVDVGAAEPVDALTEQPRATASACEPSPSQPSESRALVHRPPATLDELMDRRLLAIRAGGTDENTALLITSEPAPAVSKATANFRGKS
jgi:hypothetical protein